MARVTVEDCLVKVENRFALVHLASKRARKIQVEEDEPMVECDNKYCVAALREVAAGKVRYNQTVRDMLEAHG